MMVVKSYAWDPTDLSQRYIASQFKSQYRDDPEVITKANKWLKDAAITKSYMFSSANCSGYVVVIYKDVLLHKGGMVWAWRI